MSVAALEVMRLPIGELRPHPKNPRKHPAEGTDAWRRLAASLAHDYFDPIVWNRSNGMLVSGHFRTKIFQSQGVTHVDVSVVDYDDATHEGRMLAANQLFGETDEEMQRAILQGLTEALDFDWSVTGIDEDELANFGVELGGANVFENASPFHEKPEPVPVAEKVPSPAPSPQQPTEEELRAPEPPTELPPPPPAPQAVRTFSLSMSAPEFAEFMTLISSLKPRFVAIDGGAEEAAATSSVILAALRHTEQTLPALA